MLGECVAILGKRRPEITLLRRIQLAPARQARADLLADFLEALRGLLIEPLAQPFFPERDDHLAHDTVTVESERQLIELARKLIDAAQPTTRNQCARAQQLLLELTNPV